MTKLFLSHSTQDDGLVRALRQALADLGQDVWIDSRQLYGGNPLESTIKQAIKNAAAYAVLVSPPALQSQWIGKELRHALKIQEQRSKEKFPVIPLCLDGSWLGAFASFFNEEPVCVPVSSAGGIEQTLHPILIALGKRLPTNLAATPQPKAEPLEELILELTDLGFSDPEPGGNGQANMRCASARARLTYEPATAGRRSVRSNRSWRLTAPSGPIEAEDLRWYLEQYAVWPSAIYHDRIDKLEKKLVTWGRSLYRTVLPTEYTANVLHAWARIGNRAGRRFSVLVDPTPEAGVSEEQERTTREAATLLLGLPWELLHDGKAFLFQGARPTRVRRRLPDTQAFDAPPAATPIRILLVSARPKDDACDYIDHRISALPLVGAMEKSGGRVTIEFLDPPTLPALSEALARAHEAQTPYHVVHFDGHGVYDRRVGLGGLCFEDPQDAGQLENRRHATVYTNDLGPLLRDYRIPLVFLEACRSAQAEQASESVAAELLKVGAASVVAMSHSVSVETAGRFVVAFYQALAAGKRVGDATLAGQRELKHNDFRGRIFGTGELRLQDWFVPVLFQDQDDPQLFFETPGDQTREDIAALQKVRLGALPEPPETGFVGRSRELLALERLLRRKPYAVIRGQGGEGKTALAVELARWLVFSRQIRRTAFVSVETHGHPDAVLDAIGHQLVGKEYSVAEHKDREQAILEIERALAEQPTLLILDNLESILPPPHLRAERPRILDEEAGRELQIILGLCRRLSDKGDARLVFTSREELPAPFAGAVNHRELHRLEREDAVKLVERALDRTGDAGSDTVEAQREAIERLVDIVRCHARTLALLAPGLQARGVEATRKSLVELMAEMERRFPGNREQSVFAGVELSLRRLSPQNQERVRVLGLFHGGVDLNVLVPMMEWDETDVGALAKELIRTGLATAGPYGHLSLHPALCPYLRRQLDTAEHAELTDRWIRAMQGHVGFLDQQQTEKIELAATLTRLELPNLFALLDRIREAGDAVATIELTTRLHSLLQMLDKPRLVEYMGQIRDAAAKALGTAWNHANFETRRTRIEQQLSGGHPQEALTGAQALLRRARTAGTTAYPEADYDLAMACFLLARVLRTTGSSEAALPSLDEAQKSFETIARDSDSKAAERMVSGCLAERGDCLLDLGRLDAAAAAYEESIGHAEKLGDKRDVAVRKSQLGTIRLQQHRYPETLAAYEAAREHFTRLDEPGTVATIWHQTGKAYQEAGRPEAAEDAYRQSLAIEVRLGNPARQADTLDQLGLLYSGPLDRLKEAVTSFKRAADSYVEVEDAAGESRARNNLGVTLRRLGSLDEARREIRRVIECKAQFGHTVEPWTAWAILADIETDAGNSAAAAQARSKAIDAYLAYRRDGGENHNDFGRLAHTVSRHLLAGDPPTAASLLQKQAARYQSAGYGGFISALRAIVAGSRDRGFAGAPDLDPVMAAEILFLLETLENTNRTV